MKGKEIPNYVIVLQENGINLAKPIELNDELESLQKLVGGYIEVLHLGKWLLVVNEEGRLMNLPYNETASYIAYTLGRNERICGTAVLLKNNGADFGFLTFDEANTVIRGEVK